MNVKGLVGPGLERLDGSAKLGNVIRQTGAHKVERFREATGREPGGACGAMGMAVVESRTVCPYVLPFSGYSARAGEGDGRRGSVLPEEVFIREVIAKSVRSSKKRLGRVKNADAAKGVSHGRPYADARTKQ